MEQIGPYHKKRIDDLSPDHPMNDQRVSNHQSTQHYSIKKIIIGGIENLRRVYTLIKFYSEDYKKYLVILIVLSIVLGLMETFQIVLLYPIMNATIDFAGPQITIFEPFSDFFRNRFAMPDIVLFSYLFILLVLMTFLLSLVFRYISLYLTKKVIIRTKRTIFDKLMHNPIFRIKGLDSIFFGQLSQNE